MKSAFKIIFIAFIIAAIFCPMADAAASISGYRKIFRPFHENKRLLFAIREYKDGVEKKYIVLDPQSFKTEIVPSGSVKFDAQVSAKEWLSTPFMKALYRYTAPQGAAKIQDQGITKGESGKGVFLTADLCPSKKPLDKRLFTSAIEADKGRPHVPVALAISGLWIKNHTEELGWIKGLITEGKIDITWVNHTFSHPYEKGKVLEENFLLTPGVDVEVEILKNEEMMLEAGITPPPFFRFPGLVSNDGLLMKLRSLTLIPIGSDAWLAKGERPGPGSIILVHGNGNEPAGIDRLVKLYNGKQLNLLPLADAFDR